MDIGYVQEYLPHRPPFLFVDKINELTPGEFICAQKNVSISEPFFEGHFPGNPIVPGVILIEAMAQAAGILAFHTVERKPEDGAMYMVVGVDGARFKKPVVPGDVVMLKAEILSHKRQIWKFKGIAEVDGEMVASAEILVAEKTKS